MIGMKKGLRNAGASSQAVLVCEWGGKEQRTLGRKEQKEGLGDPTCYHGRQLPFPSKISREERAGMYCYLVWYFICIILLIILYFTLLSFYHSALIWYFAILKVKLQLSVFLASHLHFKHQLCIMKRSSIYHVGFNHDHAGCWNILGKCNK